MDEVQGGFSRREALKTTAKVAGAAAFLTPVVVGVFNSSASAAVCSAATDSDVVESTVISANYVWNLNCGGGAAAPFGRYNGQNKNFTLQNGTGTVQIGSSGTDNPPAHTASYTIFPPAGFASCSATFKVVGCTGPVLLSSAPTATNTGPVPYCTTACNPGAPSVTLQLVSVSCCPSPT